MEAVRYEKSSDGIVTLTMDLEGPVNKLSKAFRESLTRAIERLEKEQSDIKGVILTSAKETFLAGADLNEIASIKRDDVQGFLDVVSQLKDIFRRLEKFAKPVVACINGAALGGGFE